MSENTGKKSLEMNQNGHDKINHKHYVLKCNHFHCNNDRIYKY